MPRGIPNIPNSPRNQTEVTDDNVESSFVLGGLDSPIERLDHEDVISGVALAAAGPEMTDYQKALAFMEEKVKVVVAETNDANVEPMPAVYVNGVPQFFPRGVAVVCKRKFVEGLVRAKPVNVRTETTVMSLGAEPINKINRSSATKYPFEMVEDANPRGRAWLTALRQEDQVHA